MKKLLVSKESLMKGMKMCATALLVFLLMGISIPGPTYAQTVPSTYWMTQFGTITGEACQNVYARENIYMTGWTVGAFPGQTYDGVSFDGFVTTFDDSGNMQWVSEFGAGGAENGYVVISDKSGVYAVGIINGATFPGETNYGGQDLYIRKYDHLGNLLWLHQFGTAGQEMQPDAIAIDATGVYTACHTSGAWPGFTYAGGTDFIIFKFSLDGDLLWGKQVGSDQADLSYGLFADHTGLYVCGCTTGNLYGKINQGQLDGFIAKYTIDGDTVWTRLFGTNLSENVKEIYGNESGLYVVGNTTGAFPGQVNAGGADAFVVKFDRDGNQLWVREFGTPGTENGYSISGNTSGVYLTGNTNGTFPGQIGAVGYDIYAAGFNNNGDRLWLVQLGSAQKPSSSVVPNDYAYGISVVSLQAYITGYTSGVLPGEPFFGGSDAFLWDLLIQTPQDATYDLITEVGLLVESGVLNQGQGNALTVKLQAAIQKINQGNYNAAINNLNAFLNQLEAFYNGGILTDEEAYDLALPVEKIIDVLEGMLLKNGGIEASGRSSTDQSFQAWNYPNPVYSSTTIQYTLPEDLYVKLKVYDSQGKEVSILVDGLQNKGAQSMILNSENLPGGVYYYKLQAGNYSTTKKLIVYK